MNFQAIVPLYQHINNLLQHFFFPVALRPKSGYGLLILEVST